MLLSVVCPVHVAIIYFIPTPKSVSNTYFNSLLCRLMSYNTHRYHTTAPLLAQTLNPPPPHSSCMLPTALLHSRCLLEYEMWSFHSQLHNQLTIQSIHPCKPWPRIRLHIILLITLMQPSRTRTTRLQRLQAVPYLVVRCQTSAHVR